jgi:hypothetical protein
MEEIGGLIEELEQLNKEIERSNRMEERIKRMSTPALVDRFAIYASQEIGNVESDIVDKIAEELISRVLNAATMQSPGTEKELAQKLKSFWGTQNLNQCAGSIGRIFLILYLIQKKVAI